MLAIPSIDALQSHWVKTVNLRTKGFFIVIPIPLTNDSSKSVLYYLPFPL